jgi:V/A-type H+-transporting ATPase subunit F
VILMYKIAVLGEKDSVTGFSALGLDAFPVMDEDEARRVFHRITRDKDTYAIIYVTETFYLHLAEDIEKLKDRVTPAVILIPGRGGPKGYGSAALESAIERAVGTVLGEQAV